MLPSIYLDEDVNPLLAEDLRARGYDVEAVSEVHRFGASDDEQMAYAHSQGRAILTHNRDDFLNIARQYVLEGKTHPGILYVPQLAYGQLLRRVS